MSNRGYYLDALLDLNQSATVREVHAHALQLFGHDVIKGDRSSCRLSLMRHVAAGRVTKQGNVFSPTAIAIDPVTHLNACIHVLKSEIERLQKENADLLNQLQGGVR
jgi:uncharacterized small protein (DUF1192 family)